jgi:hypothetical protein
LVTKTNRGLHCAVEKQITEHIFENDYWDGVPDDQEFPVIDYSNTKNLTLESGCCLNHCMVGFLEAYKIPKLREFSFEHSLHHCTNWQESCRWVRTILHKHKFSLTVLDLSFDPRSAGIGNFAFYEGVLASLQNLSRLSLKFSATGEDEMKLNLQPLLEGCPSVISLSIVSSLDYNLHGLNAFPWEECSEVSLNDVSLPLAEWTEVALRLVSCKSLQISDLSTLGGKYGLVEFLRIPSLPFLRTMDVKFTREWITGLDAEWPVDLIFPALEVLRFDGTQRLELVKRFCQATSILSSLRCCCEPIEMFESHWNYEHNLVDKVQELCFPNLVNLEISIQGNLWPFRLEEESQLNCRLENAAILLEKSPFLQRFTYSFNSAGLDKLIDLSGFIKVTELKHSWENLIPDFCDSLDLEESSDFTRKKRKLDAML